MKSKTVYYRTDDKQHYLCIQDGVAYETRELLGIPMFEIGHIEVESAQDDDNEMDFVITKIEEDSIIAKSMGLEVGTKLEWLGGMGTF